MRQKGQWRRILWIVLILSALLLVALLVIQLSRTAREDDKEREPQQTETPETEESQTQSVPPKEQRQGYIIIGDSHIVVAEGQGYATLDCSVEEVILNENLFFVHTGLDPVMGTIDWLQGDGAERIREIITQNPELSQWNIISMHGTSMTLVPDISTQYIQVYKEWMDSTFYDCNLYLVSVPPLDEAEWLIRHPEMPDRTNQQIAALNEALKEAFPDQFFDYYDWFLEHNNFQDEIHYTGETYHMLFDEIIGKIAAM